MVVVLLNLLLYRNSFCGIFRQASVLQASCRSASFQGMEVVKGSNKKKKKADPRQGCNTGLLFPAGSGVSWAPSPFLSTFQGCVRVPLCLLLPLFTLDIKREGVQPLSRCFCWCCWRGGMAQRCEGAALPVSVPAIPLGNSPSVR